MAAKHFMIYYQKGSGTYVVTEPRPWARENQHHFPNYNFQPTTIQRQTLLKHGLLTIEISRELLTMILFL
jgi:hypothetical protein